LLQSTVFGHWNKSQWRRTLDGPVLRRLNTPCLAGRGGMLGGRGTVLDPCHGPSVPASFFERRDSARIKGWRAKRAMQARIGRRPHLVDLPADPERCPHHKGVEREEGRQDVGHPRAPRQHHVVVLRGVRVVVQLPLLVLRVGGIWPMIRMLPVAARMRAAMLVAVLRMCEKVLANRGQGGPPEWSPLEGRRKQSTTSLEDCVERANSVSSVSRITPHLS
jgi:hypothetical protein